MKRLLQTAALATTTMTLLVLSFVPSASADSAFRIRMFGCADGLPGFNLVPADTPLFVQSGWTSGTRGLVQSAIQNTTSTVTDQRAGATTVYYPVWGPIEPFASGGWIANWRVDIPSLALGDSATVTMTQSIAHPQADLGLPTKDDEQAGLSYFNLIPAGIVSLGAEPNPTVCTITAI
jgi:hypothetical protein